MDIISKRIGKFIAPGREVKTENGTVRPEVDVSIASMKISSIKEKNGMNNVEGTADGAEFSHSGYVASSEPIFKIIEKAKEDDVVLLMRFEKKRKANVDPNTPMSELASDMNTARKNIVKTLCGVYDFKNDEWILTDEAQSNPAEDPEEIGTAIKGLSVSVDDFFAPPSTPTGGSDTKFKLNVDKERESKENSLISMYFFLIDQEKAHNYKIPQSNKLKLAKVLLKLANYFQMETFNLEEPVYSAYSHTRARFLLFQLTEKLIPLDEDAYNDIQSWASKIQATGTELWDWALTEVDTF